MKLKVFTAGGLLGLGHETRAQAVATEVSDLGATVEYAYTSRREDFHLRDLPPWLSAPHGRLATFDLTDVPSEDKGAFRSYPSFTSNEGKFPFAVIRKEIKDLNPCCEDYVAVSLGGLDPTDSTYMLAKEISSLFPTLCIKRGIVMGYGGMEGMEGRGYLDIIGRARVIVSSCGNTALEALYLGKPLILVSHNLREHLRAEGIGAPYAGRLDTLARARVTIRNVLDLVPKAWYKSHVGKGIGVVDGGGAQRIASAIVNAMHTVSG